MKRHLSILFLLLCIANCRVQPSYAQTICDDSYPVKTITADPKLYKTPDDLYYGLRLDYAGSPFEEKAKECFVIRFKSEKANTAIIPKGEKFENLSYPFTGTGFTAGKKRRLGVPEWYVDDVDIEKGAEIWKISEDGTETLLATFDGKKFIK